MEMKVSAGEHECVSNIWQEIKASKIDIERGKEIGEIGTSFLLTFYELLGLWLFSSWQGSQRGICMHYIFPRERRVKLDCLSQGFFR